MEHLTIPFMEASCLFEYFCVNIDFYCTYVAGDSSPETRSNFPLVGYEIYSG